MVYTPEEKRRMDALMLAFADYVAQSTEIDVAWSDKSGYVRLIIDDCADSVFFLIENFDDMLQMFFYDILADEVAAALRRDPALTNRTMDYSVPYQRLKRIVNTMDSDREYALKELDKFIETWKNQDLLP